MGGSYNFREWDCAVLTPIATTVLPLRLITDLTGSWRWFLSLFWAFAAVGSYIIYLDIFFFLLLTLFLPHGIRNG